MAQRVDGRRTTRRRSRLTLLVAFVLGVVAAVALVPDPAEAGGDLTGWSLTTVPSGGPLTLDVKKVSLRGPDFKVLLQQADGSFADVTSQIPAEQDYLGTVEGHPDAVVAMTVLSDGSVQGEVVLDRGVTWWFTDHAVTGTRGSATVTYKWPLRRPMDSDIIGSSTYLDEVGYDIDSSLYTAMGSPAKAMDMAQLSLNLQRVPWIQDAGMVPVLGTVILRGSSAQDPYAAAPATTGAYLGVVQSQWQAAVWSASGHYPDTQVQAISNRFGGGVAWINDGSQSWDFSAAGGSPTTGWAVTARHEGSHNFGINDEHGGDPEGATIQSGNAYARYDSTELYAFGQTRNAAAAAGWIKPAGVWTASELPPYATTAYIEATAHGADVTFDPITADHSANGSPLHLVSVQGRSQLGAAVSASGDQVTYHPLDAPTSTIDTFSYVVGDANGHTATGIVMVKNLQPFRQLEAETGTTLTGGSVVTNGGDHSGPGYVSLTAGVGHSVTWTVNQPAKRVVTLTFMTKNGAAGNAAVTVDGGTPVTITVPQATAGPESEGTIWTPVSTTVHLAAGPHTISYTTADVAQSVDSLRLDWPDAAPTLAQPITVAATAGRAFSLPLPGRATDTDEPNDALSYSLQSPDAWCGIAGSSLTGTPPAPGIYTAILHVSDASGLTSSTSVTLNVAANAAAAHRRTATRIRLSGHRLMLRLMHGPRGLAHATLVIQRRHGSRWVPLAVRQTKRNGATSYLARTPGRYRAVFAGTDQWLASRSKSERAH